MSVKKKPLVVVTRKLPDSIETRMRELFDARLNLDDTPLTGEPSFSGRGSAGVLLPTATDMITQKQLKQPEFWWRRSALFREVCSIDQVTAAHARGITVT